MDNLDLITCTECGRQWDGNAQCNCFMYNYTSDEEIINSPRMIDKSTQTINDLKKELTPLEKAQLAVDKKFN